jgi:phospholipid transport system substrate-binding protein
MKIIISIFLTLLLLCSSAFAAEKSEPRLILENTMNQVIVILNQPEFKNAKTNQALLQEVKDKLYAIFDFKEFSARAVGGAWRTFTPEQQENFVEAFGQLLYATYRNNLLEYNGQKFIFKSENFSAKGDKIEILTTVYPVKNNEAPVNFRMLQKPEGWKIYDIIIENVSMIQNYSNQFKEILKTGTPAELIAAIQKQANEQEALKK